jgi:trans-aconitate methyltransferase
MWQTLIEGWIAQHPQIAQRFAKGGTLLDLKCGRGDAVIALARAFPQTSVYGFDDSPQLIAEARERARGVPRVRLAVIDWRKMPVYGFDLIATFDAVFDSTHVERVRRALSREGILLRFTQREVIGHSKSGARLEAHG